MIRTPISKSFIKLCKLKKFDVFFVTQSELNLYLYSYLKVCVFKVSFFNNFIQKCVLIINNATKYPAHYEKDMPIQGLFSVTVIIISTATTAKILNFLILPQTNVCHWRIHPYRMKLIFFYGKECNKHNWPTLS